MAIALIPPENFYELFIKILPENYELFSNIPNMETVMKTIVVKNRQTEKTENGILILATAFMSAGFLAPVAGMAFAIVHTIVAGDIFYNRLSTILFAVSIPLLFVGSHFLDVDRSRRNLQRQSEIREKINYRNKSNNKI